MRGGLTDFYSCNRTCGPGPESETSDLTPSGSYIQRVRLCKYRRKVWLSHSECLGFSKTLLLAIRYSNGVCSDG